MNILLGLRMAVAGGRESLARMALMAMGVAMGVPLILVALSTGPVLQAHIDRLAWHRTTELSPATAPDHAMWLAVTDRFAGRDVIRVHVAPLGPRPPVPPGVDRLPGPGEKLVSPALARLLRTVPAAELGDRYPGRVVGTIGPDGLIMPDELVAIIGQTPAQMRAMRGAVEIQGIERPGSPIDPVAGLWGAFFAIIAVLTAGPVVVFVAMTTRVGGSRREQRFAAFRLAGATRLQTAALAVTETALAATVGTLLGWSAFRALRPVVASRLTLGHGMPIFVGDVRVPLPALLAVLLGVPLLAAATTLVTLHPVQMTPLGVRLRTRRRPPTLWRLAPLTAGLFTLWLIADESGRPHSLPVDIALRLTGFAAAVSVLVGFFLAGAWLCMWISRGMARASRSGTTLIVARRIAADPYTTFRTVGAAAIAIYAGTSIGFALAAGEQPANAGGYSVLDRGVVAVHVGGVPEAELGPLMTGGAVVARLAPGKQIVVSCVELARVTDLACPLPVYREGIPGGDQPFLLAEDLFTLPHPNPTGADVIFQPFAFSEPSPATADLPVQTVFVPTDGTRAAQERVRTLAAVTVPQSRSKTSDDLAGGPLIDTGGFAAILPYAMILVLLFTACSLTVSVITGVLERRRPFALLRASGVRLGELRRMVLLETGAPLLITVLFGVGVATVQSFALLPPSQWIMPSSEFLIGLAGGVAAAFAVSLIALPFMNAATRHDTVRFE